MDMDWEYTFLQSYYFSASLEENQNIPIKIGIIVDYSKSQNIHLYKNRRLKSYSMGGTKLSSILLYLYVGSSMQIY